MKTFAVLLQTGANSYELKYFNGETSKSLYPIYRPYGMAVEIREKSEESVAFLTSLSASMQANNSLR